MNALFSSLRILRCAFIGFVASAFSFAALAQAPAKVVAKGETVRIQVYPGTIGGGHPILWAAIDKGFCTAHGLKCQLVEIPSGPLGLQALAAGSIEVATATVDVAMQAAARGNDIQLIAGIRPTLFFSVIARDRNAPKGYPAAIQGLKGKKIGVSGRGSGTEIQMRAILAGAGIKPEDVTFVAVGGPATAYQTLQSGQVDAVINWSPIETVCKLTDTCIALLEQSKGEGPAETRALNGANNELSATRKLIESNPVMIDAFIQALNDSERWIKDPKNFDEVLAIAKKRFSMGGVPDPDQAIAILLREEIQQAGTTLDRKAVQSYATFLHKYKVLDKLFDTSDFVYKNAPAPR